MKAVILCGGKGTRIRGAGEPVPKPLLPIGDRPIVWHIMKIYGHHSVSEFVLCLGYKGWLIKEFFLNYRAMTTDVVVRLGKPEAARYDGPTGEDDWTVTLAETGEETMTGGRVAAIRRYVENDGLFLLTYGDGVADVDIGRLVAFHREQGRVATVTAVRPPGRFGEILLDGPSVTEFNEKPQASGGLINGGFLVCDSRRIWDYIGDDPRTVFEREPMRRLAREGQLAAYEHPGFWQPMDTLREYELLNEMWVTRRAPWKVWRGA
ncbi:MAG: glucose-1-phosphate cytidylyltransferase [Planctomycetales bacterium]|nr:glucose-1-phosphate cytidylyltransferase [Planctomycetales bacterium]